MAAKSKKQITSLPSTVWPIMIFALLDRFTYFGFTAPLQNYIQNKNHISSRPGALGLGQSVATDLSFVLLLLVCFGSVGGAVVADLFFGRFSTIIFSSGVYIAGLLILFATSLSSNITNGSGLAGLICALVLTGVGIGSLRACLVPFLGDQCSSSERHTETTSSGGDIVADEEGTLKALFGILYWFINVGTLSSLASTWLEKKFGFWTAYLLAFLAMLVGTMAFVVPCKTYRKLPPLKSEMYRALRALWSAVKNGFTFKPMEDREPETETTITDELRRGLMTCTILATWPIFLLCQSQCTSNLKSQANDMQTHGIPNDSLFLINPITVVIFQPLVHKGLYPALQRAKVSCSQTVRILVGFCLEVVAMAWVTVIQHRIYVTGPCYSAPLECSASQGGSIPNQISVAYQLPVYFIEGLAEVFAYPAMMEITYEAAPKSMKSVVQSLFWVANAVSAVFGIAMHPLYQDPRFIVTYSLLTALMAVDCFVLVSLTRKTSGKISTSA